MTHLPFIGTLEEGDLTQLPAPMLTAVEFLRAHIHCGMPFANADGTLTVSMGSVHPVRSYRADIDSCGRILVTPASLGASGPETVKPIAELRPGDPIIARVTRNFPEGYAWGAEDPSAVEISAEVIEIGGPYGIAWCAVKLSDKRDCDAFPSAYVHIPVDRIRREERTR